MLFDIIWCLFIELIENGIIFKKRTKNIEIRIMVSKSYNTLYFVPNADLKKKHCSENTLNEDSHWSNHCPLLSTKNMLLRLSVNFVVISSIFWRNFQLILSHLLLISLIEFLFKKPKNIIARRLTFWFRSSESVSFTLLCTKIRAIQGRPAEVFLLQWHTDWYMVARIRFVNTATVFWSQNRP